MARRERKRRLHEQTFNQALGQALRGGTSRWRGSGLDVRAESLGQLANSKKRPDILIQGADFRPVIVESSFDANDADKDARSRLEDGARTVHGLHEVLTTVAVHIPPMYGDLDSAEEVTAKLASGSPKLRYSIHQRMPNEGLRRWPRAGFLKGDVFDLVRLIPAMALPKETVEMVAEDVASHIKAAADRIQDRLPSNAKKRITELMQQRDPSRSLQTAALLWLNAMLVQQRLFEQDTQSVDVGPRRSHVDLGEQVRAWETVLDHNWRSIFEPAVEALRHAREEVPSAAAEALRLLAKAVEHIETAPLGMQISVGAELYPKLTDDRKEAAAFYTQPATAELLAALTIRMSDLPADEWAGNVFERHRLADLACGTGTLLRAGYRRVEALHERCGGNATRDLHKTAMERGLVGTDVSPIAAHLTASSLAATGYGEPYGDTQIGWVNVGRANGLTGALEFLAEHQVHDLFEAVSDTTRGRESDSRPLTVDDSAIKWILMNPPYSRTRGGQSAFDIAGMTTRERLACQRRWSALTRNEPVNNKAGMAASFLALAHRKTHRGGRIGFVLPLTAAFADSWAVTRRMVVRRFKDIVAVAVAGGEALGTDALSADTNMEEMLLVGTKHHIASAATEQPIRCVTLHRSFTRVGEAGVIARVIAKAVGELGPSNRMQPVMAGDEMIGMAGMFAPLPDGGTWSPLGVSSMELAMAADALARGRLVAFEEDEEVTVPTGMATIGEVFDVGPTHHLIGHRTEDEPGGAFEIFDADEQRYESDGPSLLWRAKSAKQTKLVVRPTHRTFRMVRDMDDDQLRMWSTRGELHYARNMRWTSQKLLAATTNPESMGGRAWTTLKHRDQRVLRAFALWANSTLGMVVHWTQGQRTQNGRSTTQIGALKCIPCPRLDRLDDALLDTATGLFSRLKARALLPACQAHCDPARKEIDDAMIHVLGLPEWSAKAVDTLRLRWCREPSVHGHNKAALSKLAASGSN